jgi:hypothetical protein
MVTREARAPRVNFNIAVAIAFAHAAATHYRRCDLPSPVGPPQ